MELSAIVIDPEFKALIPPLSASERSDLETNILADGCVSPLVVWQGHSILLDGHNRHEICQRHAVACQVHTITLDSRNAAKAWIIKHQLGRRNLKESQRAMLAATLKEMFVTGAMQRRADGCKAGGRARQGDTSLASNLTPRCKARDEAAAAMNVSSGLVHAAEKVKAQGSTKLQQAVTAGELSVSAAAEVTALPQKDQDHLVSQGATAVAAAAKEVRKKRQAGKVFQPILGHSNPPPMVPLSLPRENPKLAASALIELFDAAWLKAMAGHIVNYLEQQQGDSNDQ